MKKTGWFYTILMGAIGLIIWLMLSNGPRTAFPIQPSAPLNTNIFEGVWNNLADQFHHPLAILLLQIITIILAARLLGTLFRKIGQPAVIGEIVAGIALGPSLLGWVWPEAMAFLFPANSLGNLQFLSQIGLLLFMFVIGMELDTKSIRNKAQEAIIISHASIVVPFALGVAVSYLLYENFAVPGISFVAFALFMGISMSITAFPVLARIVQERGLTRTPLGNLALTCAAADDVTAWCLLAGVIALVKAGGMAPAVVTIALSVAFIVFMFWVIKPLLARIASGRESKETVNKPVVAIIFLTLLGSAYVSEIVGIHALFGAFLAGVIMPDSFSFKKVITDKIEDVALVLLLPLFFVFTGLRTEIGMLNTTGLWITCLGVTAVAVAGKLGGSALAARFLGQSWHNSLSIGVLMNTRGLMELVVLNIGYDLGILGPQIFTMMVFMALFTTFMTGPALSLVNRFTLGEESRAAKPAVGQNIMISFGRPGMGAKLLWFAHALAGKTGAHVSALHVSPISDISPADAHIFEKESFADILQESAKLHLPVSTLYRANEDIDQEIMEQHHRLQPSLLLMGGAETMFRAQPMGLKIRKVLGQVDCDVLLLSDHHLVSPNRIVIGYYDHNDLPLLRYAHLLAQSLGGAVTVLLLDTGQQDAEREIANQGYNFAKITGQGLEAKFLNKFQLLLLTAPRWQEIFHQETVDIESLPSVLVLQKGTKEFQSAEVLGTASQVA
jgi:Kef-type K+ transport system membrane component KefB